MKQLTLSFIFALLLFILPSCSDTLHNTKESTLNSTQNNTMPNTNSEAGSDIQKSDNTGDGQEDDRSSSIILTAVGDNILHNTVIASAKRGSSYDFSDCYKYISSYIQNSDIAVVNQEAPLGGKDYKPSGYPCFCSPQEVGRDLVNAGFNVISHANNHAMDKGAGALYDTMDFWDNYKDSGVLTTGIYRDHHDRDKLRIMTVNNISVGFLSYTYGTNGIPLPADNPDIVSLIDKDRIAYDMERLVPECDIVAVIMHWGNEYTHNPTSEQKELAQYLCDLGAGIIIGHHPHVIQPYEWLESENGNKTFCIYSLGNFLSSQDKADRLVEGMLTLTIKKENDEISLENISIIPLVNYYDKTWETFCVYPLSEYTEEIAETHKIKLTPDYAEKLVSKIFGEYLLY